MRNKFTRMILASAVILSVCGCGYTTRSLIAGKYKTICVEPFVNRINLTLEADVNSKYKVNRPMLETEVTRAVINKFLYDGNVKPVSRDAADLVLKSELTEFRRDPLRYTTNDDVEEYRINIVVNMELWDKKNDKPVWEEKGFTGYATYFVTGSKAKSEESAVVEAINDLSRRIVERVVEQW